MVLGLSLQKVQPVFPCSNVYHKKGTFITVLIPDSYFYFAVQDSSKFWVSAKNYPTHDHLVMWNHVTKPRSQGFPPCQSKKNGFDFILSNWT